jgi:hypothetical protein
MGSRLIETLADGQAARAWLGHVSGMAQAARLVLGSGKARAWLGRGSGKARAWLGLGSGMARAWLGLGSGMARARLGYDSGMAHQIVFGHRRVHRNWSSCPFIETLI